MGEVVAVYDGGNASHCVGYDAAATACDDHDRRPDDDHHDRRPDDDHDSSPDDHDDGCPHDDDGRSDNDDTGSDDHDDEPVFAPDGGPGRPPSYDRRRILEAIFYIVRTGAPWRLLPHDFPPWENDYAHFRRWAEARLFERMHDILRARWREREGRAPTATGSVIDSQSVKTTEKGGPADSTPERRSRDENDTSS